MLYHLNARNRFLRLDLRVSHHQLRQKLGGRPDVAKGWVIIRLKLVFSSDSLFEVSFYAY